MSECERSAGDGGTCADEPDADLVGWCDACSEEHARIGELEAQVSTLASLVSFAYLVDVEFAPEWMEAARHVLAVVGWEVDPQDWRNWNWSTSEGATT